MTRRAPPDESLPHDLQDLRAFCKVVDLGSLTTAARALGETKGTVSRRLTRLERAVGVVLVQRSPRRVQPTEDGAAYRDRVGRALELLADAHAHAQQARTEPAGHLRVTAPPDLGASLLAPLIPGFLDQHPGVSVELLLTDAMLDFDAQEVDVALRATSALPDSALVAHKVDEVEGKLYASPAYLAKHGAPRRPAELHAHRMVLSFATARGQGTLALRRAGGDKQPEVLELRAAVSSTNMTACKEAAAAGAGIALLPTSLARADVDAQRLVAVLPEYAGFTAALYLVHAGPRALQPKVRAFRDYMLDALGVRGRR